MRKYMLLIGCVFLLAGCTKSNIVTPDNVMEPNFDIVEGIELDQDQIKEDVESYINSNDEYDFGRDLKLTLDEPTKTLTIIVAVDEQTDPAEAADFASYVIRAYADAVSTQDFSYKAATDKNYGDYFNEYNIQIRVVPLSLDAEESTWIVNQLIKAGENTPVEPLKK